MDVALITSDHSAIRYISKYVSKFEPGNKRIHIDETTNLDSIVFQTLEKHQTRPMSLQESIFTILELEPMFMSWRTRWCISQESKTVFVSQKTARNGLTPNSDSLWMQYIRRSEEFEEWSFCKFLRDWKSSDTGPFLVIGFWNTILAELNDDEGFLRKVFRPTRNPNEMIPFRNISSGEKERIIQEAKTIFPFIPCLSASLIFFEHTYEEGSEGEHLGSSSDAETVTSLLSIESDDLCDTLSSITKIETVEEFENKIPAGINKLNIEQLLISFTMLQVLTSTVLSKEKTFLLICGAGGTGKSHLLKVLKYLCDT